MLFSKNNALTLSFLIAGAEQHHPIVRFAAPADGQNNRLVPAGSATGQKYAAYGTDSGDESQRVLGRCLRKSESCRVLM
ncbi:hypothetical protein BL250_06680 [Erwinia sp. OLTSP20]|nr:hypothetical protein BV501_02145 [Erwinia sp. OAMSP11]PIJ74350.1 hypothetical protein BK416_04085 [Erwinia sp. OLSSP12]PIJ83817.1 hypothetical protein BLD47_04040 [Erwinia sp. OLCASP19]PIJ86860.1 hypothetical protein BLD46_02535 [Erwinia sp. OLMTSP26]PIJ88267.1 hypothetical protein BLD49_03215 [Erwinia sp. OLMDSP33]PIJ91164.1 hypothetical protein BL249_09585 [Erwinia sp. OLFS4]PIJ93411.1 hypothetical protein BL250_06680 [Erwinia sp. OLTSP20]